MADDVFLKINGITGESLDEIHEGEIQVRTYSTGATSTVGSGTVKGTVRVQDIHFTKYVDSATPQLMKYLFTQKHIPKATLTIRKASGGNPLGYLVYELTDVVITSHSAGYGQIDELVSESFSLSFGQISVTYKKQSNAGDLDGAIQCGWNLATNRAA
jgi:type VI secretion system secreted protein Hcp